jgi:hypothetical protein
MFGVGENVQEMSRLRSAGRLVHDATNHGVLLQIGIGGIACQQHKTEATFQL